MEFIWQGFVKGLGLIVGLDPEIYGIAGLSLGVSLSATLIAAMLGAPLGMFIGLRRFRGRRALIVVFNTLLALPTVVVGLLVYSFLSAQGPLGFLDMLYTPGAMVAAQAILAFPIITALTISAVRTLDRRVEPAALTLGATGRQAAWAVAGEARMAVIAALAAGFGRVLTEVGAAIMVGGNIRHYTRTFTTSIVLETSKGDFAQGMALGIILLIAALGVNLLANWPRWNWK